MLPPRIVPPAKPLGALGFARAFLRLAGQCAGLDGLRAGINAAAGEFFLDIAELLPQQAADEQPAGGQHGDQQRPFAGHKPRNIGPHACRFACCAAPRGG